MNNESNTPEVSEAEAKMNAAFESLRQSSAETKAAIDSMPDLPFALRHPVATAVGGFALFLVGVVGTSFTSSYISEAGRAKARKHFG